jgi:hypothetical protein
MSARNGTFYVPANTTWRVATGDGVTDDTAAIQAALYHQISRAARAAWIRRRRRVRVIQMRVFVALLAIVYVVAGPVGMKKVVKRLARAFPPRPREPVHSDRGARAARALLDSADDRQAWCIFPGCTDQATTRATFRIEGKSGIVWGFGPLCAPHEGATSR